MFLHCTQMSTDERRPLLPHRAMSAAQHLSPVPRNLTTLLGCIPHAHLNPSGATLRPSNPAHPSIRMLRENRLDRLGGGQKQDANRRPL